MPLTGDGFTAYRAADLTTTFQATYEAELASLSLPTDVAWDRDTVLGTLSRAIGLVFGDLSEGMQALYDAFSVNNAEGVQLDNLLALVGLTRQAATASVVDLTLSGTPATLIPAGSLVEDANGFRWSTDENATIGGGGTVAVSATCTTLGPVVATANTITVIVSAVSGWTSVDNAAAAVVGQDRETDADARLRRALTLSGQGERSVRAMRSALLDLDYVDAAVILENDLDEVVIKQGVTLPAHSVAVVLYPSGLTNDQVAEVARILAAQVPAGIWTVGTAEVETVILDTFGGSKTVRWDYASDVGVDVTVSLTLATGFVIGDVQTAVEDAITAYFDGLAVGEAARRLAIFGLIDEIAQATGAITGATVLLDGFSSDVTATAAQRLTLDVLSVS